MPQRPQHPKHTHHPRLAHPHPSVPGAWLGRPHGALASRWHGTCSKTSARPLLQPHGQSLEHRRAQIARAEARCSRRAAHVMTPRICPQKPPARAPSRSSNSAKPRPTSPFHQPPMLPLLALETICNHIANPSTHAMYHCALALFQHPHFNYRIPKTTVHGSRRSLDEPFIADAAAARADVFPTPPHRLHLAFILPGVLLPEKLPAQIDADNALLTLRTNALGPMVVLKHFAPFLRGSAPACPCLLPLILLPLLVRGRACGGRAGCVARSSSYREDDAHVGARRQHCR